ncbi:DUF4870 family protein [Aestuariibacter salexigens]|uniref:DUF4870 family protein n=1 Tax=Aestuariibacter salexigens TaxID=226010 RepID=UPI0003F99ABE|nr:membrane protein [Aestuariibacter salexigens]
MTQSDNGTITTAKVIYVLYLISIVSGITGVIGVVMAYVYRDDAPAWLRSHFRWQIRTFWIGAGMLILGTIFSIVLIGWLLIAFWVIWLIIRCVKGLRAVDQQQPCQDVETWLF